MHLSTTITRASSIVEPGRELKERVRVRNSVHLAGNFCQLTAIKDYFNLNCYCLKDFENL